MDSNGDGIGDLRGIIQKLDYIKDLGIDIIWLSPVYKSPNDDNGYDISDYRDIMEEFGTLEDFHLLLKEAHNRNIKVIMDLVLNHTSDEHQWFMESRKSADNKYRDYYIWRKGKNGQPPNNWGSIFGGSAWEYDKNTDMYYLHLFSRKQPDLNWENEKVREEIYDMVRWWLDKGVDGFRIDAACLISKHLDFPDGIVKGNTLYGDFVPYVFNRPRVQEFLKEMNREVFSKHDIVTVGETPLVDIQEALKYSGEDSRELDMVFHFEHVDLGHGEDGKWSNLPLHLKDIKRIFTYWQKGLENKGWDPLFWGNHDQPRSVSTFGNDKIYWKESAKMLVTCLHMMRGTPFIYQGDEIGMTNVAFDSIEEYNDIETINAYNELVYKKGRDPQKLMEAVHARSRDNARTPMQWDGTENAGFTKGKPWIKLNPNYKWINAASQIEDEDSILNYYKRIIKMRKQYPVMIYGSYNIILEENEQIYAYTRTLDKEKLLVICNFSEKEALLELPDEIDTGSKKILISNYKVDCHNLAKLLLKPYETRVYLL